MQDSQFRVWYLFLTQVIAIAGFLHWFGQFEATTQVDTASYRDYSFASATNALNDKRTFVYPSVLRFFQVADGSERLIPWFQYLISSVCIGAFLAALLVCHWNPWLALSASSPLLASPMVLDYSRMLTPDLLAQSFSILVIAHWLVIIHKGTGLATFIGLAVFLFLAYQTKPSYLFLLLFVPIGGWMARWWLNAEYRDAWRVALRLTAASAIPFLVWCAIRWFWVGHFGLVSFGGYNIIGIAGQLDQRDSIDLLTAEVQPLAKKILLELEARDWPTSPEYDLMESHFNPMVWEVAVPAAAELYGSDSRTMNRQMANLSSQILLAHPRSYLSWIGNAAKHSVRSAIEITLRNPIVSLFIPCWLVAFALRWHGVGSNSERMPERTFDREFQTILWTALGYAVCKLGLVILVEPPIDRYCAPAALFFPCVLVMSACKTMLRR